MKKAVCWLAIPAMFALFLALPKTPASAVDLKLEDGGVAASNGEVKLVLSYPTMQGAGDKTIAKVNAREINGTTATLKYDNGGQADAVLQGNKVKYKFSGFGADVKNWKMTVTISKAQAEGAGWKIGKTDPKPFPAVKANPPHIFEGADSAFTFVDKSGKSLTITVPNYSYLQLTDLREWGTPAFNWNCFSPFYAENPTTELQFSDGTATPPAAPPVPAGVGEPAKNTPPRKPIKYLSQPTDTIDTRSKTANPFGCNFVLLKDWTFGKNRPNATIKTRADLDKEFYYRYIYENGKLDTIPTYWTYHRDYPEGDPKNLHVIGDDTLTLKARVPEGGGLRKRGIESGMLRTKFAITPGMYIEMRAKLTTGIGAWPAFWLNSGVQNPDGTFSDLNWPPEIDIFEFFNWQGRPNTKVMSMNVHANKKPEKFGYPYDIFTLANKTHELEPGFNFDKEYHVFALDWRQDQPMWILDGQPVQQMYYEWNGAPAHLLITNQLGIDFADMKDMKIDEGNWDYVIDYIRVWKRQG